MKIQLGGWGRHTREVAFCLSLAPCPLRSVLRTYMKGWYSLCWHHNTGEADTGAPPSIPPTHTVFSGQPFQQSSSFHEKPCLRRKEKFLRAVVGGNLFVHCVKFVFVLCKCWFLCRQRGEYWPDFGIIIFMDHHLCWKHLPFSPSNWFTKDLMASS